MPVLAGVPAFAGTTVTLTNPGTVGTNLSVPRLMENQGLIVGTGALRWLEIVFNLPVDNGFGGDVRFLQPDG